jgi:hypothetical protein
MPDVSCFEASCDAVDTAQRDRHANGKGAVASGTQVMHARGGQLGEWFVCLRACVAGRRQCLVLM